MKSGEVATLREQDSIRNSYENVGRQCSWWGKGTKYRANGYIQGTGSADLTAGSAHRIQCKAASFQLQMGGGKEGSTDFEAFTDMKKHSVGSQARIFINC